MAKKKGGKSSGYCSAGINSNVSKKMRNALRADYLSSGDRLINQYKAFKKGKNVMVTIANPDREQTNKRFIRVTASTVWK